MQESQFGGRIPFKARVLAAVPGKSLNNRTYTRELLQQSAPLYEGKPFIMDHDIEHVERVVGIFSRPRYATERGVDGQPYEGLWLDAVGLMDEDLFDLVQGTGLVPPLVRGFSIGGMGEGDWTGDGGIILKKFIPAEGSLTAFPGIPAAHVATINAIEESVRRHSREVNKTSIPVREAEVSLEDAEKLAAKERKRLQERVREGSVPPADNPNSVRSIRGLVPASNDSRPGLPAPTSRMPVTHTYASKGTTSSDGNANIQGLDPEAPTAGGKYPREAAPGSAADAGAQGSKDSKTFKRKDPKLGQPTKHPGFGNLGPSGSGLADGEEEEEEEEALAGSKGLDNPHQMKTDKTGSKFQRKDATMGYSPTKKPGFKKGSPSGTGLTDQPEEEEEEEHTRPSREEADNPMQDHPGRSCGDAHPGMSHDDFKDQDEEEEEEEEHGPSPHTPGLPIGKRGGHAADDSYDSPSDKDSDQAGAEEEEEETQRPRRVRVRQDDSATGSDPSKNPFEPKKKKDDGVTDNPILKTAGQGHNVGANPVKDGGEEEEEEEEEEETAFPPDTIPIEGRAFSMPLNAGILQTMARIAGPKNATEEQINQLFNQWQKLKQPAEDQSIKKMVVKRVKPLTAAAKDGSLPSNTRPAPHTRESVIRTRSVTNIAPTFAATSVSTLPIKRAQELLDEERRKTVNNLSYNNAAKRAWMRIVPELLDIR